MASPIAATRALLQRRAARGRLSWAADTLSVLGLIVVVALALIASADQLAFDAHAYWLATGYDIPQSQPDAFSYTPVALLAFRALAAVLPWPVFLELYTLAIAFGIWALAGPLTLLVSLTPQVASEILVANIHVFLALVAVAGLRWPGLWAFALLTKVTPGIGALWFVFRGEWRKAAWVLGVTVGVALPTVILLPGLWLQWIDYVSRMSTVPGISGFPLVVRLPIAVALVYVGARRTWPWLVPVGAMLALPVLWELQSLSMLLGVVWFFRRDAASWFVGLQRGRAAPPVPSTVSPP
jgi:hypothetical protein